MSVWILTCLLYPTELRRVRLKGYSAHGDDRPPQPYPRTQRLCVETFGMAVHSYRLTFPRHKGGAPRRATANGFNTYLTAVLIDRQSLETARLVPWLLLGSKLASHLT